MAEIEAFKRHRTVNTEQLSPDLRRRALATLTDPRLGDRVRIASGARTKAHQERLYAEWKAGRYNVPVVADPNRKVWDPYMPGGFVYGSRHMVQPDGYAHAIDFDFVPGPDDWPLLEVVAKSHGLRRTVPSEGWHYELDRAWRPPAPEPSLPPDPTATETETMTLVEVHDVPFTDPGDPLLILCGPWGWQRVVQGHAKTWYRERNPNRTHIHASAMEEQFPAEKFRGDL